MLPLDAAGGNLFRLSDSSTIPKYGKSGRCLMTANQVETKLNTPAEEAAACRVTKPTLLGWYHAGVIPAVYAVGRIIRFDHAEVLKALAARKEDA
jgi:hypothetical protein